jgi:ATP-dependent DNA helicase RecG
MQKKLIDILLEIPTETQNVEFKRLRKGSGEVRRVLESVVSMANADGGIVVLGIDDPEKSKLKGVKRVFGIEENLENYDAIGREIQKIIPPISNIWPPRIIEVKEIGKRVAVIEVPKAADTFYSFDKKVYVRQEKSNKCLTPQEVIKFSYAKGFTKADRELVNVDFKLLSTEYYTDWKISRGVRGKSIKEILEKTGLARKSEKGKLLPTRAAVLLFAEYPNDLLDTKCLIRVFQWTGTLESFGETPNLVGVPKNIGGAIVKQIAEAHEHVLTLLRSGIKVPSGFTTQYQIPERAVKEAITNAVIHRDYYMKRDIEIRIFEDRVEIESPGLFPYNITPTNIGFVRSEGYRNDLLVKHLREFSSPPNLDQNEGVKAMRNVMTAQNLYPPIFFTYPRLQDSVRVILLNEKVATEWERVSHYLKTNKYITNEEARKITHTTQRDKMTQILKRWVERGLLVQLKPKSGYVRGTKYKLANTKELDS